MYDMITINIRLNLAIFFILENTLSYNIKCPELSHRNHRADSYCPSNSTLNYACLLDRNENQMSESCSDIADFAPLGDKYIIAGRRTTTQCSVERYQPFKLYANISHQCLFRKSICSEEGQILLRYLSTIADKTCQCDFNKGYDYLYRPRDPCSCIPSEEDCSCYLRQRFPGYICDVGSPFPPEGSIIKPVNIEENAVQFHIEERKVYPPLIAACIVLSFIVIAAIYIIISYKRDTDNNTYRQVSTISSANSTFTNDYENAQNNREPCPKNDKNTKKKDLPRTISVRSEPRDNYAHSSDREDNNMKKDQTDKDTDSKTTDTESIASTEIENGIVEVKGRTVSQNKFEDVKLVVAIDIGTTSSVYAYCLTENIKKSHLSSDSVKLNKHWDARKGCLCSPKTPTCILLSEKREVIAIGYDAQTQYRNYIYGEESQDCCDSDETLKDCFFVDKFKMELYSKKFFGEKKPMVKDVKGRYVSAEAVFSGMILKLKELVQHENSNIHPELIRWVLTVPAIWTIEAKKFMRICASKAGISKNRLSIIVESEAASVYIYQLMRDDKLKLPINKMPSKYLVIDIGGGTSDITAHSVKNGKLKKLCEPTGSDNGGKKVDHHLMTHFEEIIGSDVHSKLQNDLNYLELLDEFESLNNSVSTTNVKKVACKIPLSILNGILVHSGETLSDILKKESSGKSNGIGLTNDRLRFEKSLINSFIKRVAAGIVSDIERVLNDFKLSKINTFIVVGGFSNSAIIRKELTKTYQNKTVIFPPQDVELAVVKGATLYGVDPSIIQYF